MSVRLCGVIPALVGVTALLVACDQQPPARSLKDEPSRLVLKVDAPDSALRPAGGASNAAARGPESRLGPAAELASTFRASEVLPEKLVRTGELLSELKARQTPDRSIVIDLPADILFDFDKVELREDALPALRKAAELVENYPAASVQINGHTDAKGSDAYNDPLSLRRAHAVADWLQLHGGRTAQVAGLGKRQPLATNTLSDGTDNVEGRQRNRRVEILIKSVSAFGA